MAAHISMRATDYLARVGEVRPNRRRPRTLRLTHSGPDNIEPPERKSQAAVIHWANLASLQWPELRFLFAVPNGGQRTAVNAKLNVAMGLKAGVPDLLLLTPRDGCIGLAIEMKIKRGVITERQQAWLDWLSAQGFRVVVCRSATEAIECLQQYVSAEPTLFGKAFADMAVPF